jgi:NADH dehydrogenase FAD-containing subunit
VLSENYFSKSASIPMKDIFHNSELFGEHVTYVQGILKEVINKNKIRIQLMSPLSEKSDERQGDDDDLELCNERDLEFDYLAICTGSSYVFNEASPEVENTLITKEKRIEFLNRYQEEISRANSILVVGSG